MFHFVSKMKQNISCIDRVDNLRVLVRNELRDIGIKVPKHKKSKRGAPKSVQDVSKGAIFGNYLAHQHCVHVKDCGYVARFLVDAANIIIENIESEGIFRKSGAVSRQKEIKQQLENGQGFEGANVHDVTALVKQFFRELPEPLFTSTYHDTFVRCYQMENSEASVRALLLLCLMLPEEHISTLRFLLKLLASVAANCEKNKMDSTNLAVVMAPNLMHVNSKSETMKSCEEKLLQVQTSVVELLISHAEDVGLVEEMLVERTAYMSEVFSTDDDLDASEDNLEDTKETQRKEKKRKRSGSFQGFVSSIAQSISKWRRSHDGKINTSGVSHASNASHVSSGSHGTHSHRDDGVEDQGNPYQFSATDATPVVRRKKPVAASEARAFSASKKKAILNNLPQQSALASTPYTPASTVKKKAVPVIGNPIPGMRRGMMQDTPSIPPRPYQTPRQSMKTPRKKINLFSPASTTKKKRYSSTGHLPVPSTTKKGKTKSILRRLSGSKGDQMQGLQSTSSQQIGERLATSPKYTSCGSVQRCGTTDSLESGTDNMEDDTAPTIRCQSASFTASSLYDKSIISNGDEETRSLNEGFIMTGDDKEVDISRIMSEPVIAGSLESGDYVSLTCKTVKESLSDSTMNQSKFETPTRSVSAESILETTARNSSLKRGRPNSIKAGLLQGDQREVQKLRRSFGLDKSEIGYPMPVSVADVSDSEHFIQLQNSFDDYLNSKSPPPLATEVSMSHEEEDMDKSPGSVSRCKSTVTSTSSLHSNSGMTKLNEATTDGYDCDDENSEVCFSAGLDGTNSQKSVKEAKLADEAHTIPSSSAVHKTLAQQKQESKDSLLSQTSSYLSPTLPVKEREMTRSISGDSGKGSLCEEPIDDSSPSEPMDSKDTTVNVTLADTDFLDSTTNLETLPSSVFTGKKSVSTQDLKTECDSTPIRVSRSNSVLDSSVAQRKMNFKPNLQISAETHKLLARAGYIKDKIPQEKFDDFAVPGTLAFPFMKEAESINPRRESIIALQKNNAGYVMNNVRQFDKIIESDKEDKFISPFRFPNSTTRRRGVSPMKISAIVKGKDASQLRQSLNMSMEKVSAGTARVPISTHMVKPSDPESLNEMMERNQASAGGSGLKRRPSIYYADKEGVSPTVHRFKSLMNSTSEADSSMMETTLTDEVFNSSLQETIKRVCTPLSEKYKQKCNADRVEKSNKENTGKTMPEIKQTILTTPKKIDTGTLRTATNKTPIDVLNLKCTRSPRSPIKPLKRLGSSPHSPRCKHIHSPKLGRSRQPLLSTISSPKEELNNL